MMPFVYDEFAPGEAQLRAALTALSLPVPQEIEAVDDGERTAALAAHLLSAATRAHPQPGQRRPGPG
ncbi:hypothetical protein [Streptomyces sp. RB17]|uniref:hypothetical protein n=1 Tax=Streptomyces sp. RB17 TaxID=2585197 RepID=UPI001E44DB89|nr:hypothetical protein [Streptomyces sp. RB17]